MQQFQITRWCHHFIRMQVQKAALEYTKRRLEKAALLDCVELICAGHENMADYVPEVEHGQISCIVFNFGYFKRVLQPSE